MCAFRTICQVRSARGGATCTGLWQKKTPHQRGFCVIQESGSFVLPDSAVVELTWQMALDNLDG